MLPHRRAVETTDETQDAAAGGRAPAAREDPRTPGNDGQVDPPPQEDRAAQLAQLRELKTKLDKDRERLVLLEQILEQDLPYPPSGSVRRRAREVHRQIVGYAEPEQPVSRFPRAGQNVVAATMLLRNMPEPSNSQARRIRDEVQTLLQVAAVQQVESSASRRRGAATEKHDEPAQNEKEVSVHQQPPPRGKKTTLVLPVDTTPDATSRRIVAVGMETRKSAVTALTAAEGMTAMRTGWPQSRQARGCSAGQSAA